MKINWKVRFRNYKWLIFFTGQVLTLVYTTCTVFGINIPIPKESITEVAILLFNVLGALGIIMDPTTKGVGDSERALTYGKFDYDEHLAMQEDEKDVA